MDNSFSTRTFNYSSIILLFSFLLFMQVGCKKAIEVIEEKDDQGNVIASFERRAEDFAKHGFFKGFHATGEVFEESTYKENKLEGLRKHYYPNGKLQSEENYVDGTIAGVNKTYYEHGSLKSEGKYINGAMKGEWKFYYSSGKLKEMVTFDNNEEQGPFKEYYENGNLKAEGFYQDGDNEAGPLKLYDEEGKLKERLDCKIVFFADVMASQCKTVWRSDGSVTDGGEETPKE